MFCGASDVIGHIMLTTVSLLGSLRKTGRLGNGGARVYVSTRFRLVAVYVVSAIHSCVTTRLAATCVPIRKVLYTQNFISL